MKVEEGEDRKKFEQRNILSKAYIKNFLKKS